MQISINKQHTTLLSTLHMCWIMGDKHHCRSPSTNSGGRVPLFIRDLRLWLVLCLTYIACNVMPTMKISTKCMCFFQISTYNIASAFYPSCLQIICKTNRVIHVWKSTSPQIRILPKAIDCGYGRIQWRFGRSSPPNTIYRQTVGFSRVSRVRVRIRVRFSFSGAKLNRKTLDGELREGVFCRLRNPESCRGVICGKFDAFFSAEWRVKRRMKVCVMLPKWTFTKYSP